MRAIDYYSRRIVVSALTTLFISMLFIGDGGRTSLLVNALDGREGNGNLLAYRITNSAEDNSLSLYDPDTGTHTTLLNDMDYSSFEFGADGRIAFSQMTGDNPEIYILDVLSEDRQSVNISQELDLYGLPLAWSPDGRSLAIESQNSHDRLLYVWDGNTVLDITPENMIAAVESYGVAWSYDDRLAITAWFGFSSNSKSEIYLWDGHITTDLSQNPTGEDRFANWSADGQVAFLSEHDGEYDIFVWDGESFENDMPDINSFINVAPELTAYYSIPSWTNEGRLAFTATPPQEHYAQIFVWDGRNLTNISQNPGLHNGTPQWNKDGHWTFSTFFSSQQVLYVRDSENRTIFTTEGEYAVWGSEGHLIFCNRGNPGWSLLLWDGKDITEIAQGYGIWAQWQGGSGVVCSSG